MAFAKLTTNEFEKLNNKMAKVQTTDALWYAYKYRR
jgi:hypothetical protein